MDWRLVYQAGKSLRLPLRGLIKRTLLVIMRLGDNASKDQPVICQRAPLAIISGHGLCYDEALEVKTKVGYAMWGHLSLSFSPPSLPLFFSSSLSFCRGFLRFLVRTEETSETGVLYTHHKTCLLSFWQRSLCGESNALFNKKNLLSKALRFDR